MGCGPSSEKSGSLQPYNRRPKISVRIQPNAKKIDSQPIVVFIFGGPGSRKGRVVDDLVTSYGFIFLSCDELVLEELPQNQDGDSSKDMRSLIEEKLSSISLNSLLEKISKKICAGPSDGRYLVDILPSLKMLLRINSLVKNCQGPLTEFEEKHCISFALNLAIPADKVLKAKQVYCAENGKKDKLTKDGQSDEADSSRTQKRASLYEQQVKTYLDYFSDTERLVTVDVTCGSADIIWYRVHELLCDLQFTPNRTVNTVIVFSFDDSDIAQLDTDRYVVEKVRLADMVNDPNDSMDKLLAGLSKYIDNHSKENESFAVMCEGTSLGKNGGKKKSKGQLVFVGAEEHPVESYLPGTPQNYKPSPLAYRYKAVSSLENEICLFPNDTPESTCKTIAVMMAKHREVM